MNYCSGLKLMKNKLLFILGVVASLVSCSLAACKLLYPYPRYVGLYGSRRFRELYEDNVVSMDWGDDLLE